MSEVAQAPQLRFPEFSGEWKEKKLDSVVSKFIVPMRDKPTDLTGSIPWCRIEDFDGMYLNQSKTGQGVSEETVKEMNLKVYPINTLLVSCSANLGFCAIVKKELITNQTFIGLQSNDNLINIEFLYYLMKLSSRRLNILSSGTTISYLSRREFENFKITTPSLPEQQKIAAFLTAVDNKIEQLSKKQELLGEYKKGLMQQIFSQAIRFKADDGSEFPDWEEKKLRDVAKITTGSSNREDSGLDGQYTFFDRSEDIRTSDRYLFDGKAVIVAGEGSRFPPKYFEGKFDLHQRTYAIMEFVEANSKYIFYFVDKQKNYLLRYAVGSTVKSLRLPIFQKMPVSLPSLPEQTKIANFLSSIDNKIEQVGGQLDKSKQFKKALLQQMFV